MTGITDALTRDGFLGGRLMLWQPCQGYRAATDPVFLAAFVPARPGESALDLGCGVGAAGLCLARRVGSLDLHGLEIQPDYAALTMDAYVVFPWDRQVLEGDQLVTNPIYEDELDD